MIAPSCGVWYDLYVIGTPDLLLVLLVSFSVAFVPNKSEAWAPRMGQPSYRFKDTYEVLVFETKTHKYATVQSRNCLECLDNI
jgi:hypothetical protein